MPTAAWLTADTALSILLSTSTLKHNSSHFECAFLWQKVELKADKIMWLGKCDNGKGKYPLSKKGQSMESLRERLHLRPRTNLIGAVARIRNALAHATHTFFQSRGFIYVHTPLITTSDCEGAGEMFQVWNQVLLLQALQANDEH